MWWNPLFTINAAKGFVFLKNRPVLTPYLCVFQNEQLRNSTSASNQITNSPFSSFWSSLCSVKNYWIKTCLFTNLLVVSLSKPVGSNQYSTSLVHQKVKFWIPYEMLNLLFPYDNLIKLFWTEDVNTKYYKLDFYI